MNQPYLGPAHQEIEKKVFNGSENPIPLDPVYSG